MSVLDEVLLIGDFNQPDTDWAKPTPSIVTPSSRLLLDLVSTHNLNQINTIPDFHGVYLDLIFSSSFHSNVVYVEDILLEKDRHHPAFSFTIDVKPLSFSNVKRKVTTFKTVTLTLFLLIF